MLSALLDGRALTASEFTWSADVAPATSSEHLAKLVMGGLLAVAQQGRYTYFRLPSASGFDHRRVDRVLRDRQIVQCGNDVEPRTVFPRRQAERGGMHLVIRGATVRWPSLNWPLRRYRNNFLFWRNAGYGA